MRWGWRGHQLPLQLMCHSSTAEAAHGYLCMQALPKGCSSAEAANGYPLAWGTMRHYVLGEGV